MKTLFHSLLTSPLGTLALALLFAGSGPLAIGQTTVWQGGSSTDYWSDPANWSNGVPTSSSDVFIGSPRLDVDATIGSLTFEDGGSLYDQGGRNLTVQGTTTFGNVTDEQGLSISIRAGSNYQLGTTNMPAGKLFGYFDIQDSDGAASRTPTVVQFRDAEVRENRGFIWLEGPDAAILDQSTGQNAFRHLETNNAVFYLVKGAVLSTTGHLTNNVELYVQNFFEAGPATQFTLGGTFNNSANGWFQLTGGSQMTVTGDFNNNASGEDGAVWIENNGSGRTTTLNVHGNLTHASGAEMNIVGGSESFPIRVNVGGNVNNAGSLRLRGTGSLDVGGMLNMTSGEIIRNGDGGGIFRITAGQIALAAGTRFDVTSGIVYSDVVEHGVFAVDTFSPGEATINGSFTLTDTAELEVQLAGTTPGRGFYRHDQIKHFTPAGTTGGTVLDGTLKVSLIHDFHKTITPQDTFSILVSDRMLSGAFNNVASGGRLQTTDGNGSFLVTYAGQNSVVLSQYEVRPLAGQSLSRSGANVVIKFVGAVAGKSYRLERKLSLTQATWESPVSGANDFYATVNGAGQITHTGGGTQPTAFYRVRLLP